MATLSVRFRVDFGDDRAVGPGKVALLEAIAATGSLSQAARDLRMSYRRAWLLLDSLNSMFRRPVAAMSTGGKGGGGAVLTTFGQTLVKEYRRLEAEILRRASAALAEVADEVVRAARPSIAKRPLQRKPPTATRARTRATRMRAP